MKADAVEKHPIAARFRTFLPVIVDVETGGFDAAQDALLEMAAVTVVVTDEGLWERGETFACHVEPFPGARLEPAALEFNRIDPHHPFRFAVPEQEALRQIFRPVRKAIRDAGCTRAVLVGHNPSFDLGFVNAAVKRTGIKRNPFHPFTTFDTATLSALAFGQTVLARALQAAGIGWDSEEAHSAIYDAERTAELFCYIINRWEKLAATGTSGNGAGTEK
ncbi:MAG: ribonuclease T [Gammaproteobacteria bacterium]|nr:ribonuclease T [Gammaproteobacteria bacterium]